MIVSGSMSKIAAKSAHDLSVVAAHSGSDRASLMIDIGFGSL
jgi:hypothetical protein